MYVFSMLQTGNVFLSSTALLQINDIYEAAMCGTCAAEAAGTGSHV